MSHSKKISVFVLGSEDHLKKALITNILSKDLSRVSKKKVLKNTEKYENEAYEVTCTAWEDIEELFAINRHPDMCLLVVEDGFSAEQVRQQVEKLRRATGKPAEEFLVVLPLGYDHTALSPLKCFTMGQVFNQLTEKRRLMSTSKSFSDYPGSSCTPMETTGGRCSSEHFTEPKKSLKRKHSGTKVNLVLLGMAGTGKSASGNTILGRKQFTSKVSSNPVTTECQVAETEIGGRHVRVIDNPDMFDDEIKSSVKDKHVKECKKLCQPGNCVFLLVMHVSRFTDGERDILRKLQKAFGSRVHEQTVVLFTRGQDLMYGGKSFEEFLYDCQPELKKIVEMCGSRCVLFENNATRSHQVEDLMQTVDGMLKRQHDECARFSSD